MAGIHLDVIRPYVPSNDIDWEAASLELTPWLDHKDDEVQREFHRFLRRDMQAFIVGFMILHWRSYLSTSAYPRQRPVLLHESHHYRHGWCPFRSRCYLTCLL